MVFKDESEFYFQLVKLLQMTKVPVILSASNPSFVTQHLYPMLSRADSQSITPAVVHYEVNPMDKGE